MKKGSNSTVVSYLHHKSLEELIEYENNIGWKRFEVCNKRFPLYFH